MRLIDANIFVYSIGTVHPYKGPSQVVLQKLRAGDFEANISTEILQEVLHIYRGRNQLDVGLWLFDDLVNQFPHPFGITREIAVRARQILSVNRHLQSRDAFHAATVFEENLEGIISADHGFDTVSGLTRFDPVALAAS